MADQLRVSALKIHQSLQIYNARKGGDSTTEVSFFDHRKGVVSGKIEEIADYNIQIYWYPNGGYVEIKQKLPGNKVETHYVFPSNIIYLKPYA